ncbi:MAG: hypothetical protein V7618_11580 [Rhodoglobus sp.]
MNEDFGTAMWEGFFPALFESALSMLRVFVVTFIETPWIWLIPVGLVLIAFLNRRLGRRPRRR